jgi:hypothetical protein
MKENILTYQEFKKDNRVEFFNKKVLFRTNEKTYFLFSKSTNYQHNEQNLYNCYEYIKENKKHLIQKE